MKLDEKYTKLFDLYLRNQLSDIERENLESEFNANTELRNEFEDYERTILAAKLDWFMQDVSKVVADRKNTDKTKLRRIYLGIAASLVLTMSFVVYLIMEGFSSGPTFAELFTPYPNLYQQRDDTYLSALEPYNKGNYLKTIEDLSALSNRSDTISFFLAMSYFSLDSIDLGIEELKLIEGTDTIFEPQLNWYLGIAYYHKQDYNKALVELRKIRPTEFKYKDAQNLIEKLN